MNTTLLGVLLSWLPFRVIVRCEHMDAQRKRKRMYVMLARTRMKMQDDYILRSGAEWWRSCDLALNGRMCCIIAIHTRTRHLTLTTKWARQKCWSFSQAQTYTWSLIVCEQKHCEHFGVVVIVVKYTKRSPLAMCICENNCRHCLKSDFLLLLGMTLLLLLLPPICSTLFAYTNLPLNSIYI